MPVTQGELQGDGDKGQGLMRGPPSLEMANAGQDLGASGMQP